MDLKTVCIVGTGPSALMAGTVLAEKGHKVVFYDQKKAPARKFLVAGHGGFNLTNDEELELFIQRYDKIEIQEAVKQFSKDDFRTFLKKIKIETFVGSSGKIFPEKGIKPITVLSNWKNYLFYLDAEFKMDYRLVDFTESQLIFENQGEKKSIDYRHVIFALGGGSWSITGSDGDWLKLFEQKGIPINPFGASNSGFVLKNMLPNGEGQTIKNCKLFSTIDFKMGDVVLTDYGIEGAPVYAMNRSYREGHKIYIDFKPSMNETEIENRLKQSRNSSEGLKTLKLTQAAIHLIRESMSKEEYVDLKQLVQKIKHFELQIVGLRPVEEVISTIGGIRMESLEKDFRIKGHTNKFCIGEMVDWDAPTGGYLIQACVAMGFVAGNALADQS